MNVFNSLNTNDNLKYQKKTKKNEKEKNEKLDEFLERELIDQDLVTICKQLMAEAGDVKEIVLKILYLPLFSKTMADFFQMLYVKHLMHNNRKNNIGYNNNFWLMTFDIMAALIGLEIECPILFEKENKNIRTAFIGYALCNNTSTDSTVLSDYNGSEAAKHKLILDKPYWEKKTDEEKNRDTLNINQIYNKKIKKGYESDIKIMNPDGTLKKRNQEYDIHKQIAKNKNDLLKYKLTILKSKEYDDNNLKSKIYIFLEKALNGIIDANEILINDDKTPNKDRQETFINAYTELLSDILEQVDEINKIYKIMDDVDSKLVYFKNRSGKMPTVYA